MWRPGSNRVGESSSRAWCQALVCSGGICSTFLECSALPLGVPVFYLPSVNPRGAVFQPAAGNVALRNSVQAQEQTQWEGLEWCSCKSFKGKKEWKGRRAFLNSQWQAVGLLLMCCGEHVAWGLLMGFCLCCLFLRGAFWNNLLHSAPAICK